MKTVEIVVVNGAEGKSLQVWGKHGGYRMCGPKAWGNPHNKPMMQFTVDADELIEQINKHAEEHGGQDE